MFTSPASPGASPQPGGGAPLRRRMQRGMGDWRADIGAARHWKEGVVAVAFLSLGSGVLLAAVLLQFAPSFTLGPALALWAGMLAAIVFAFAQAKPTLLVRFRFVDLVYGLGFGVLLRLAAGWIEGAARGGDALFPSYVTVGDSLGSSWWLSGLVGPVVIAPLIEEFFFRGVLLVAVYVVVRRLAGQRVASVTAVIVSVGAFLVLHSWTGEAVWSDVLSLAVVGLVCVTLVFATGRIWGAVLLHAVYNLTFVGLALVGTWLG